MRVKIFWLFVSFLLGLSIAFPVALSYAHSNQGMTDYFDITYSKNTVEIWINEYRDLTKIKDLVKSGDKEIAINKLDCRMAVLYEVVRDVRDRAEHSHLKHMMIEEIEIATRFLEQNKAQYDLQKLVLKN